MKSASSRNNWFGWLAVLGILGPEGGDISPDGREFWAANSSDGSVSIIDMAAKKVMQTLDVKNEPFESTQVHTGRKAGSHL